MKDEPLNNENAVNCPWCNGHCMYLEEDSYFSKVVNKQIIKFRIGAGCDEHWEMFESELNDSMGNDFGRGFWCENEDEAVLDWNFLVKKSIRNNHQDTW